MNNHFIKGKRWMENNLGDSGTLMGWGGTLKSYQVIYLPSLRACVGGFIFKEPPISIPFTNEVGH